MKIIYMLIVSVFILALNAYAGGNDLDAFAKGCGSSTNLGEPTCTCLANKADHRLTPGGFSFLVASFNNDDAKTKELRGKLGVSELMKAGMFMVNTPKECVGETGGN